MYEWWELVAGWAVMCLTGLVQGTTGLGFSLLSVPVLSLIDPRLAPIPQILMSLPVALYMAWREHSALELGTFGWMVVGRVPGSAIGAMLLVVLSRRALNGIISLVVLLAVAVLVTGVSIPRTPRTSLTAGVVSGITATTSAIGGPPLALLFHDAPGAELRSNISAVFGFGVVISVAALLVADAISTTDLVTTLLLLPAALLGLYASRWLTRRVEGAPLRQAVLSLAALAALILGVRTLTG